MNYAKLFIQVDIIILDVNDNSPKFLFKYPESRFSNGKYFGALAVDSAISTSILQVKAEDADSGPLGAIVYEIVPESNRGHYFSIDRSTGIVRSDKLVGNFLTTSTLPVKLIVVARDNPGQDKAYRDTSCQVVVSTKKKLVYSHKVHFRLCAMRFSTLRTLRMDHMEM